MRALHNIFTKLSVRLQLSHYKPRESMVAAPSSKLKKRKGKKMDRNKGQKLFCAAEKALTL